MEFKEMQTMLRQAGKRKKMIVEMQCEIAQLERQKEQLAEYKAVQLTGMPSGNGNFDSMGNKIVQIEKIENRINQIISEIEERMAQNEKLILLMFEVLTPDEYAVIKARYLNGYRWDFIPGKTMNSRSTCMRIHERAVKKLVEG